MLIFFSYLFHKMYPFLWLICVHRGLAQLARGGSWATVTKSSNVRVAETLYGSLGISPREVLLPPPIRSLTLLILRLRRNESGSALLDT